MSQSSRKEKREFRGMAGRSKTMLSADTGRTNSSILDCREIENYERISEKSGNG